jgi:hypothetical protein
VRGVHSSSPGCFPGLPFPRVCTALNSCEWLGNQRVQVSKSRLPSLRPYKKVEKVTCFKIERIEPLPPNNTSMLTMLGWHSTPLPLGLSIGKRAQLKAQKVGHCFIFSTGLLTLCSFQQATMPYVPKTIAVQSIAPQSAPQSTTFYKVGAGSYAPESQRPPIGYPVQHLGKSTISYVKL